jgi:hypothetical protein
VKLGVNPTTLIRRSYPPDVSGAGGEVEKANNQHSDYKSARAGVINDTGCNPNRVLNPVRVEEHFSILIKEIKQFK